MRYPDGNLRNWEIKIMKGFKDSTFTTPEAMDKVGYKGRQSLSINQLAGMLRVSPHFMVVGYRKITYGNSKKREKINLWRVVPKSLLRCK